MKTKDLHALPKVRDSASYLYVEHCRIDREAKAIALHDAEGSYQVPCANLTTLMVGPGTSITHAAVQTLADAGTLVLWMGEQGVRFYAQGMGETRAARNLLRQAWLCSHDKLRLRVVRRLYEMRFVETLDENLTLQQIRGKEGIRVREAYQQASRASGVEWAGRAYKRDAWKDADPVNRALSAANSCLYGICHAAIVSAGYSPALGFIHTGKMLSFVYDIADLYKVELTVPLAFQVAGELAGSNTETEIRRRCRDTFYEGKLLQRIIPDIEQALAVADPKTDTIPDFDADEALPGGLWNPEAHTVQGGINWSDDPEGGEQAWS
ncbi:MAG: type I-E CRISPR-associated endonuclease Cas1e [Pyrinomonadaceae bacterium MAG19_C2-C3]|nr:type I-E CRISPR-associated endonuclease Cas1e [Pyrinomonadaceae bacterium MAG19_C2-C3]